MTKRAGLLVRASLGVGCLLAAYPRPGTAYIDFPPPTLGSLCGMSHHIYVLRVEKASAEKGVILFQCVEQLKGKPDATAAKHVIGPKVEGAKTVLDGAAVGKTAVLFTITSPGQLPGGAGQGVGHAYLDGHWYSLVYNSNGKCWMATRGVPALLTRYCGTPARLRDTVADILRGKDVVVPCLVHGTETRERRHAKIHHLRASLRLKNYDPKRDFVGWGAEEK
jgi:hypothetical protein